MGHAFLPGGGELARAQIAWQLDKRYTQDEPLDWGCAFDTTESTVDPHAHKPAVSTQKKPNQDDE